MKLEGYLPIGTIVRLNQYENSKEENDVLHMIIGYDGINTKTNKESKYILVIHPFGLVTDDLWFCNEEDIHKVIYEGYYDEDMK